MNNFYFRLNKAKKQPTQLPPPKKPPKTHQEKVGY